MRFYAPISLTYSAGARGGGETNLNISGTMKNLTCEPRMYTWSRCDTRPSRAVTVMSFSCTFMLSSAGTQSATVEGEGGKETTGYHTLDQLSAEDLAGGEFERADVALDIDVSTLFCWICLFILAGEAKGPHLGLVQQLDRNPNATHDCVIFLPVESERCFYLFIVNCEGGSFVFRVGGRWAAEVVRVAWC